MYKLLLGSVVISNVYGAFIPNPLGKAVPSKFQGLVDIVTVTVYITEPIFTGLGHGKFPHQTVWVSSQYWFILSKAHIKAIKGWPQMLNSSKYLCNFIIMYGTWSESKDSQVAQLVLIE